MTVMVKELRDALVEAGATSEKADAAATAVLDRVDAFDRLASKADLYRALLIHAGTVIAVMVALKLFP